MEEPGANPHLTLANDMFDWGITDAVLFDGDTKASRIATELFDDNFTSCMDKTYVELDDESYYTLTAAHIHIRLTPGHKKNIKVFIQWTRDYIRIGIYPITVRFTVANASDFIKRYKHNDAYVKKPKKITETVKPDNFTDKIKWIGWYPTFINFLHDIPGRNGIPLSYICRPVSAIIPTTGYVDFIDEYVDKAPLNGQVYLNDASRNPRKSRRR